MISLENKKINIPVDAKHMMLQNARALNDFADITCGNPCNVVLLPNAEQISFILFCFPIPYSLFAKFKCIFSGIV